MEWKAERALIEILSLPSNIVKPQPKTIIILL